MISIPRHYRDMIMLSAPIAGIQFAQIVLTSTDLMMMGLIGMEALAAGGLATLLYNQFRTMCVGMVTGLGNLIAASIGRAEKRTESIMVDAAAREEIRGLVRSALFLATVVALIGGGLLAGLGYCLTFLGQDDTVVALARPVMITLAPGLLPMVWLNVLRQFAVGMRRPGSLLWVTVVSIAVNVLLNAMFIYGWLGLPRLGLTGVGLSTTFVQVWTFLVYLRAVQRDEKLKDFLSLAFWKARPATVLKMAKMGTPISLTYGLEASITSVASILIGNFGPVVLAASNVINQLAKIVYQINVGLSHGSSIMVSRAIGKQEYGEIGVIARGAMTICFIPMTAIGLVYLFFPHIVLWPFLGAHADPAILSTATTLLWFAVFNQFFTASQNISIGLLRGLGNTKAGLSNSLISYWLIGIPAILFCSDWLGWGGAGVWFGLCIAFGASSVLLWRRFMADLKRISQPG
ncbi:MATE family efflux transporter [Cupriavidus sp. 2TAF22]|uniref:MATE family efflux transporter n=1 Tax=unclassified Cupriavidus TaxID=2640874 RepID=UPI003F923331